MIDLNLSKCIEKLTISGKGILAADESIETIGKRFDLLNIENTEKNRRNYRLLLATTPNIEKYISGVILFEETLNQCNEQQDTIPEILSKKGILVGIKVDKGLVNLPSTGEKLTQGLDGLDKRLKQYKEKGVQFAKWRNVYTISHHTPTTIAAKTGAETLARYASICQSEKIVPIIEPEILMDGDHQIDKCLNTTQLILHELFQSLYFHRVNLNYVILKLGMVISGNKSNIHDLPETVATNTLYALEHHVPVAVPSINFLSGGQTPEQASRNLNAIGKMVTSKPYWNISYSYGRALQEPCLLAWMGQENNIKFAQQALFKRCHLNSLASLGHYSSHLEEKFPLYSN